MRARSLIEFETPKAFLKRIGQIDAKPFAWDTFNPDGADRAELRDWAVYIGNGKPVSAANRWFPGKVGRVTAVKNIRAYLWNMVTARRLREEGRIELAQTYERIADIVYTRLPDYARW